MKKLFYILPLVLLLTSCEEPELSPRMVKITGITIYSFPMTASNGTSWDYASGTDLYIDWIQGDEKKSPTQHYIDVTNNSLPLNYELANDYMFNDLTTPVILKLYDFDDIDANDFISQVSFNFSDRLNRETIYINENNTNLIINLEWYY